MPSRPRKQVFDPNVVGSYHLVSSCVRRAYLCGRDGETGRNYDHRRDWLEQRLRFLAGLMGLDILACAFMSNHYHVVVRNRPDIVSEWSDREIAVRWLSICPGNRTLDSVEPAAPDKKDVDALLLDQDRLLTLRKRLSSISWFMRFMNEYIARRANLEEDSVSALGAFWNGRFKSTRLLDSIAVLVCVMYVDLNPIRSGSASRPELSRWTSAYVRIAARQSVGFANTSDETTWSSWLCAVDATGAKTPVSRPAIGQRASNDGFLDMSFDEYLQLLDVSGRSLRSDKRGAIPENLPPILDRISLETEKLFRGVSEFEDWFGSFAGSTSSLQTHNRTIGQKWTRGAGKLAS